MSGNELKWPRLAEVICGTWIYVIVEYGLEREGRVRAMNEMNICSMSLMRSNL